MLLITAQCVVASAVSWACWRMLRRLGVKTDLDNVPGPDSKSFLNGECGHLWGDSRCKANASTLPKGVFSKVFSTDAWDYHKEMGRKCMLYVLRCECMENSAIPRSDGRAVRINAILGVSTCILDELRTCNRCRFPG